MIITKKYILDNMTERGAWTKPQIEALGIQWPPAKGWIELLIDNEISSEKAKIFESKVPAKARNYDHLLQNLFKEMSKITTDILKKYVLLANDEIKKRSA